MLCNLTGYSKRSRLIDTENRLMVARGKGVGGGIEKVKGSRNTKW